MYPLRRMKQTHQNPVYWSSVINKDLFFQYHVLTPNGLLFIDIEYHRNYSMAKYMPTFKCLIDSCLNIPC